MTRMPRTYTKAQLERRKQRIMDAKAVRDQEIIKVDLGEALKLAEAAQAMLKALKAMCDEPVGVTAAQWQAAYNAIAQAEAAGITTGEDE